MHTVRNILIQLFAMEYFISIGRGITRKRSLTPRCGWHRFYGHCDPSGQGKYNYDKGSGKITFRLNSYPAHRLSCIISEHDSRSVRYIRHSHCRRNLIWYSDAWKQNECDIDKWDLVTLFIWMEENGPSSPFGSYLNEVSWCKLTLPHISYYIRVACRRLRA